MQINSNPKLCCSNLLKFSRQSHRQLHEQESNRRMIKDQQIPWIYVVLASGLQLLEDSFQMFETAWRPFAADRQPFQVEQSSNSRRPLSNHVRSAATIVRWL